MYSTLSRCLRLTFPDAGQRTGDAAYRLRIGWSVQDVLRGYRLEYSAVARHPLVVDRRWRHGKRPLLRSARAESLEDPNRSGGQAVWKPLVRGGPTGNSTRQEQTALPLGTPDSHPRRHAATVGDERTASSRV